MAMVSSLEALLRQRLTQAFTDALSELDEIDPKLQRSDRADWQANGALAAAKVCGANPRALAERVVDRIVIDDVDDVIAKREISGPGFINVTVSDKAIINQLICRIADARLGIGADPAAGVTVIDYSQPNIAKEMHVGHLRSTIIGDALVRILEFAGEKVIRRNHLGDWGTQFGMLIQDLVERPEQAELVAADSEQPSMSRLNRLYRAARERFDSDSDFAQRARKRVVELQAGDEQTVGLWRDIVAESKRYFEAIYAELGVLLTDDDAVGESFYNPFLAEVCAELEKAGVAVYSEGALCVFFDDIVGRDGKPVPLIIRKSDGGYGYGVTDLAAIRHRVQHLGAAQLLYVVDSRQMLHFRMVFETARRAGWIPADFPVQHVAFGSVLGTDGKPFKTRAGKTVRLMELIQDATDRAAEVVREKNPTLTEDELDLRARQVGVGAIKYADLSTSRTRDYVFDVNRMVSLTGNTGVYLQYAYARIQSILRRVDSGQQLTPHAGLPLEPAERTLGLLLDGFDATLASVRETFEPHRLCGYLYELAVAFTAFYDQCSVLHAPNQSIMANRVLLCRMTAETLRIGMDLLGIEAPEQL